MILFSPIFDGIRCIILIHGRREDLAQDLVPVVTPSRPSSPEGLTNEVHVPHVIRDKHEFTEEANILWIGLRYLLLGFGK